MRVLSAALTTVLQNAQDGHIAPLWFFHLQARRISDGVLVQHGFWTGDEDIVLTVQAADGSIVSRTYRGQCGLQVSGLQYVSDLSDNPVDVTLSALAPASEAMFRGSDLRLATVEIHASMLNGGAIADTPFIVWCGYVDSGSLSTSSTDSGESSVVIQVRSELIGQMLAINPAKSSDEHQRRRNANDSFSVHSGTISARKITWYKD